MLSLLGALAALLLFALAPGTAAATATFIDLPFINAWDVSDDGGTVVGASSQALLWTPTVGVVPLGALPGDSSSAARAVSGDGARAVGRSGGSPEEAFEWTQAGSTAGLGGAPSAAYGISPDASVVVGQAAGLPVSWNGGAGPQPLPGTDGGLALDATNAGAKIVGQAWVSPGYEAALWEGTVLIELENLGGGSAARSISADGTTIGGCVAPFGSGARHSAALWTDSGLQTLGTLPGTFEADVWDVSGDGSVAVGFSGVSIFQGKRAFIWDASNGMRDLKEVLESRYGLDLSGWTLEQANGISADGLVIAGNGIDPDGRLSAWVAVIPEPATGSLMAVGLVGLAAWRRRQT
jgi:uncharacterized membrane protein